MTETIKFNFDFGVNANKLGTRMAEQTWIYFGRFFDSFSFNLRTKVGRNFIQEIIDNPNLETMINDLSDDSKEFILAMAAEISKDFPTCEKKPKEEEEVFYKEGDKFSYKGAIFRLTHLQDNVMCLIDQVDQDYHIWATDYSRTVKDRQKITQEEFNNITDHNASYFKLIK